MAYKPTNPYIKKPSNTLQYAADRAGISVSPTYQAGVNKQSGVSSGGTTQNAYASYLSQLQADRAAVQQRAEQLAQQKQQAAQDAYNKNMGYLSTAYDNRATAQQKAYQDAVAQLEAQHASGAGTVNQNADDSQQQAYINYMMQKRDTPQALTAQGLTGGMAESTIADMANNYGNNRNAIDKQRNVNLGTLADTLAASKSSALQNYQNTLSEDEARKMAYQMELESNLANGMNNILQSKYDSLGSIDSDYTSQTQAIQAAIAKAAASGGKSASYDGASTAQAEVMKSPGYKRAYNTFVNGGSAQDVYDDLVKSNSLSESDIDAILAALGL